MKHVSRRRTVVRLTRVLGLAGAVVVLNLVPATVVRASTNLLSNPGFESPVGGTQTEGTANPSFGNWTAYNFRPSIPMPAEVGAPSPVHGGQASGEVGDPPGIGSAFFFQDLLSFDPNSTYTISAWVYPESGEQGFYLGFGWDRGSQGNTTGSSSFGISPTATGFGAWGQGASAPPVAYKMWHHIELVVNGATLTSELYVDGVYEGTAPSGQAVPSGSSTTLIIGNGSGPPSETRFFWDDLEITSAATGIVGEWQGNGNANDSVGTNNGTLVDGGYAAGQNGQAFQLDGTDDYVTIPSTAMSSVVGAISVSAWIQPASLPTSEGFIILSQYDTHDTGTAFDLELLPGGHLEWVVTNSSCDSLRGGARTVETSSVISAGHWSEVAGTYNPSTGQMSILVNGVQTPTHMTDSASVPSLCRSSAPLRIGAAESLGGDIRDYFDGEIEDVKLYNTDISGSPGSSGGGTGAAGGVGSDGGSRYVAMGDSYSSGEGTASYDKGTDTGRDKCHRSSENVLEASYPRLLQLLSPSVVPSKLTFVACSGATINDVLHGRNGEQSQINALGNDVTLVTISVGGDDLGFPKILENCVNEPFHDRSDQQCQGQEAAIDRKLYVGDSATPPLRTRLIDLYRTIKRRAPHARIVVMGYPHLFPLQGDNRCGFPGTYLDSSDIRWLNKMALELDLYLSAAVNASGVAEYVSTFNAMTDANGDEHNACPHLFVAPWINELQLLHPFAFPYTSESFHPNNLGYVAFAGALLGTIERPPVGAAATIQQGQTLGYSLVVPRGTASLTASIGWPGSTVATTLISPKGKVINAQKASKVRGVQHELGPTYEFYTITNPEPGKWRIMSLGVAVSPGGEPLHTFLHADKRHHKPPIAQAKATLTHGGRHLRAVFTAKGSRAVEGRIKQYVWNFGDRTRGTGRRVRHTYRHPGHYTALLEVVDSSGARTLASTKTITIRR